MSHSVRHLLLVAIVGLAFFTAFIPRWDYAYPVHLDEWQVMAFTNQLMEQGGTNGLTNPIYGGDQLVANQMGELGTHIFWGAFKEVTGSDWLAIFTYFPGVIFMITVLSVFILADRQGFGWQAAFFASLLPTTVGILGPAFLVPISLAMLFIPLTLFVAFNFRHWWSYPLLSILIVAPAAAHPPTAAVLVVVLVPYMLLSLKSSAKHGLGMALAITLPFAALVPAIYSIAVPMAKRLFIPHAVSPFVDLPPVIPTLGYVTVMLGLVGVVCLAWKGRRTDYGLVLGTVAPLAVLAVFFSLHFGVEIVYQRGLQVAMLMLSILAGAGLMVMARLQLPPPLFYGLKAPFIAEYVGRSLAMALVALALATVIPARIGTPYYHMIDLEDYRAFMWTREHLGAPYDKALLDPWKGMAFVGLTGKAVFSWIGEVPDASAKAADQFLNDNCTDTAILKRNGVSVVINRSECSSPELVLVREYVYLLGKD